MSTNLTFNFVDENNAPISGTLYVDGVNRGTNTSLVVSFDFTALENNEVVLEFVPANSSYHSYRQHFIAPSQWIGNTTINIIVVPLNIEEVSPMVYCEYAYFRYPCTRKIGAFSTVGQNTSYINWYWGDGHSTNKDVTGFVTHTYNSHGDFEITSEPYLCGEGEDYPEGFVCPENGYDENCEEPQGCIFPNTGNDTLSRLNEASWMVGDTTSLFNNVPGNTTVTRGELFFQVNGACCPEGTESVQASMIYYSAFGSAASGEVEFPVNPNYYDDFIDWYTDPLRNYQTTLNNLGSYVGDDYNVELIINNSSGGINTIFEVQFRITNNLNTITNDTATVILKFEFCGQTVYVPIFPESYSQQARVTGEGEIPFWTFESHVDLAGSPPSSDLKVSFDNTSQDILCSSQFTISDARFFNQETDADVSNLIVDWNNPLPKAYYEISNSSPTNTLDNDNTGTGFLHVNHSLVCRIDYDALASAGVETLRVEVDHDFVGGQYTQCGSGTITTTHFIRIQI